MWVWAKLESTIQYKFWFSPSKNFSSSCVLRNCLHERLQTNSLSCCSFTLLAESLFQVRRQLEKLDELLTRLTYDGDPIPVQRPQLLEKVNFLLYNLFRKCVSHCQCTELYLNWYNSENTLLRRKKKIKRKRKKVWISEDFKDQVPHIRSMYSCLQNS